MTRRVLVCGAGGFIGSHLVKRLKRDGLWVRGVDLKYPEFGETAADDFVIADLRDPGSCRYVVDQRFDEGEVSALALSGQPTTLSWTPAARADVYDLTRGPLSGLPAGYGSCFEPLIDGLSHIDGDLPGVGDGYGYLVRGHDLGCGGGGTLGNDSAGAERTSPCP